MSGKHREREQLLQRDRVGAIGDRGQPGPDGPQVWQRRQPGQRQGCRGGGSSRPPRDARVTRPCSAVIMTRAMFAPSPKASACADAAQVSPATPAARPLAARDHQLPSSQVPEPSAGPAIGSLISRVIARGGEPLSGTVRAQYERQLQHDFSQVRIHTDPLAAASARAIGADAYTSGTHIVLADDPGATRPAGRRVLAHELAHVLQQGGYNSTPRTLGHAGTVAEQEAADAPGASPMASRRWRHRVRDPSRAGPSSGWKPARITSTCSTSASGSVTECTFSTFLAASWNSAAPTRPISTPSTGWESPPCRVSRSRRKNSTSASGALCSGLAATQARRLTPSTGHSPPSPMPSSTRTVSCLPGGACAL